MHSFCPRHFFEANLPLNVGPMTLKLGFPLPLNFATLCLGKTRSLHF
jgi:hypothetical protein